MTPEQARVEALNFENDHEVDLLAAVIGGRDPHARAQAVLAEFGGLLGVQRASVQRLRRVPGLGPAGAAAIRAAFELSRRASILAAPYGRKITGPDDVAEFLQAFIGGASQEVFVVLGLDARGHLRLVRQVAMGSLTGVEVNPREVFRPVIEAGLHAVILVHNHPSGDSEPSVADVQCTERMVACGRMLGIPVADHIVATRMGVMSMALAGLVPGVNLVPGELHDRMKP